VLERCPGLEVATSATTRPLRVGEVDGRDYHFLAEAEFDRRIFDGEFLEHVTYVSGQRYGTLRSEVERILADGRSCVLELETQGARAVKQTMTEALTIFIEAPSFDELRRRLVDRATESAGEIDERLALARRQMDEAAEFDHRVVNDDVECAVTELKQIVAAASCTTSTLDRL